MSFDVELRGPSGFDVALSSDAVGGLVKVWTGSTWSEKPLKIWNGAAWVQKPVKVWTGSAWVLA